MKKNIIVEIVQETTLALNVLIEHHLGTIVLNHAIIVLEMEKAK